MKPPAPLQGIRILAIEQFGAGPWSSMLLADLGAEVIKIENPLSRGDIARQVASEIEGDDSVYFQSFNRNKKSITLNLNHPEAPAVLHPLVGTVRLRLQQPARRPARPDGPGLPQPQPGQAVHRLRLPLGLRTQRAAGL